MSTLFLFGAGASFGSLDCIPERPPLGKDLYSILCGFSSEFAKNTSHVEDVFRRNFEEGMLKLLNNPTLFLPNLLKIMSSYFLQFRPGSGNLYIKLISEIGFPKKKCIFSTLNYDTLLETSIMLSGHARGYGYIETNSGFAPILKPHGSCNLIPEPQEKLDLQSIVFGEGSGVDFPMKFVENASVVERFNANRVTSFGPGMSFFAPGKRTLMGPSLIEHHRSQFSRACKRATRIAIIGVAVTNGDTHIWDILAAAPGTVAYFDPFPEQFKLWANSKRKGRPTRVFEVHFEGAISILKKDVFDRGPGRARW